MTDISTEIMTKGDFAKRMGVSAPRVSQWIKAGQISGDALVGEGRSARINVDIAGRQVKGRLDVSQRLGVNGSDLGESGSQSSGVRDELAELKLRQETIKTEMLERQQRLEHGAYMLTEDVRRIVGQAMAGAFSAMELSMAKMADAISAEFQTPTREVQKILASEFLSMRRVEAEKVLKRAEKEKLKLMPMDARGPAN